MNKQKKMYEIKYIESILNNKIKRTSSVSC